MTFHELLNWKKLIKKNLKWKKLLKGPSIKVFQNLEADSWKISWVKTKYLKIISIGRQAAKWESNFPVLGGGVKWSAYAGPLSSNFFVSKMFQGTGLKTRENVCRRRHRILLCVRSGGKTVGSWWPLVTSRAATKTADGRKDFHWMRTTPAATCRPQRRVADRLESNPQPSTMSAGAGADSCYSATTTFHFNTEFCFCFSGNFISVNQIQMSFHLFSSWNFMNS